MSAQRAVPVSFGSSAPTNRRRMSDGARVAPGHGQPADEGVEQRLRIALAVQVAGVDERERARPPWRPVRGRPPRSQVWAHALVGDDDRPVAERHAAADRLPVAQAGGGERDGPGGAQDRAVGPLLQPGDGASPAGRRARGRARAATGRGSGRPRARRVGGCVVHEIDHGQVWAEVLPGGANEHGIGAVLGEGPAQALPPAAPGPALRPGEAGGVGAGRVDLLGHEARVPDGEPRSSRSGGRRAAATTVQRGIHARGPGSGTVSSPLRHTTSWPRWASRLANFTVHVPSDVDPATRWRGCAHQASPHRRNPRGPPCTRAVAAGSGSRTRCAGEPDQPR